MANYETTGAVSKPDNASSRSSVRPGPQSGRMSTGHPWTVPLALSRDVESRPISPMSVGLNSPGRMLQRVPQRQFSQTPYVDHNMMSCESFSHSVPPPMKKSATMDHLTNNLPHHESLAASIDAPSREISKNQTQQSSARTADSDHSLPPLIPTVSLKNVNVEDSEMGVIENESVSVDHNTMSCENSTHCVPPPMKKSATMDHLTNNLPHHESLAATIDAPFREISKNQTQQSIARTAHSDHSLPPLIPTISLNNVNVEDNEIGVIENELELFSKAVQDDATAETLNADEPICHMPINSATSDSSECESNSDQVSTPYTASRPQRKKTRRLPLTVRKGARSTRKTNRESIAGLAPWSASVDLDVSGILENVVGTQVTDDVVIDQESVDMFKKSKDFVLSKTQLSDSGHIQKVRMGGYDIDVWYRGSYPAQYAMLEVLNVCPSCFEYFASADTLARHEKHCPHADYSGAPGDEIYRDTETMLSVFRVIGEQEPIFCGNLCRLTMLWLKDKVVYADVEPFDFFVVVSTAHGRFHPMGYFSKERNYIGDSYLNLSCFCVFPCYHRMGLGSFLIDFSYTVTKFEQRVGGPERPLSTLGESAYLAYWREAIISSMFRFYHSRNKRCVVLKEVSEDTGIIIADLRRAMPAEIQKWSSRKHGRKQYSINGKRIGELHAEILSKTRIALKESNFNHIFREACPANSINSPRENV